MTTTRRRTVAAVVATLLAVPAVALSSASPAWAVGCQSDSAAARITLIDDDGLGSELRLYRCSGNYRVNREASLFEARGWSGRLYTRDVGTVVFCNGDVIPLASRYVWTVAMAASRLPEC